MRPGGPGCSRGWSAASPKAPQEWPARAWWPWSRPIYPAELPGGSRTHAGQGLDLFRSGPVNCDEPTCGHAPRSHACSAAAIRFRMVSTSGVRARYRASDPLARRRRERIRVKGGSPGLMGGMLAKCGGVGAGSPASWAPTTAAGRYSYVGLGWMPMGGAGGVCKAARNPVPCSVKATDHI